MARRNENGRPSASKFDGEAIEAGCLPPPRAPKPSREHHRWNTSALTASSIPFVFSSFLSISMMAAEIGEKQRILLHPRVATSELIWGSAGKEPSCGSQHLAAATSMVTSASRQTLLARAGSTLPIGISPDTGMMPNSPKETPNLALLFTGRHQAPLPSLPQPATPAAKLWDRAGPELTKLLFASLKQ